MSDYENRHRQNDNRYKAKVFRVRHPPAMTGAMTQGNTFTDSARNEAVLHTLRQTPALIFPCVGDQ
jgi:hypothetical protein